MLTQTHEWISDRIIEQFTEDDKRLISKSNFIAGSKAPDLILSYRMLKHTFEQSFDTVWDVITNILTQPQTRLDLGFQLGIVTHFITDYCCSYHSNPHVRNRSLVVHLKHEFKISAISDRIERIATRNTRFEDLNRFRVDFRTFLEEHYNDPNPSPQSDLDHALSCSKSIVDLIMFEYRKRFEFGKIDILYKPRIAIFTDTYYPHYNGVSNTLYQYLQYLDYHKVQYLLIAPDYKRKVPDKERGFNIVKVRSLPFLFYPDSRISVPRKRRLNKILQDFDPEIVHCITEWSVGVFGMKYAKRHNLKLISNYTTHYDYYLRHYHLGLFEGWLWKYMRWFHNNADITLCPSDDAAQILRSRGVARLGRFDRGISDQFNPTHRNHGLRDAWNLRNRIIILYVGRLSQEKDLTILLESYESLKEKHHDRIGLVIVGDGPQRSELEQTAGDDVVFTGYISGKELYEAYASADIFAFPSQFETLGNVVLEAMASGLPVVGVNKGGVVENIRPHHNGLLARPGDAEDFAKQLDLLISDDNLRKRMQTTALDHCRSKHWTGVFQTLLHHFRTIKKQQVGS